MFERLLFPTDCSHRAESLVAFLTGLVPKPEHVYGVVVLVIRGMEQTLIESQLAQARSDLDRLVEPLRKAGIDAPIEVLTGHPADVISRMAKEKDCSAIVIGAYGKSPLEELLKGSLSGELTRSATLPVLYVRFGILADRTLEECWEQGRRLWEHVMHPTDFSDCSRRALDLILERFADRIGAVELTHVVDDVYESGEMGEAMLEEAHEQMESYLAELAGAGVPARAHVVEGDPVADNIRMAGELGATLVVMGSHGKGLVKEAMVGSVSQSILRLANKPVLVVR